MALGQSSNPMETEDGKPARVSGAAGSSNLHTVDDDLLAAQRETNRLLEEILGLLVAKMSE